MNIEHPPDAETSLAIYSRAARAMGIEVTVLDPQSGVLAEMRRGESRRYILAGHVPLNDSLSARLADDKFYTALLLRREGIATPECERCLKRGFFKGQSYGLREGCAPALDFASRHGFPLIAKPNRLCGGRLVSVVSDESELREALEEIWTLDPLALVQRRVPGIDVRLDFLDGEFLAGYTRRPLRLIGDGRSTIRRLAERKDRRYASGLLWKQAADFPDWNRQVLRRGWDENTVLPPGVELTLGGDILNLRRFALAEVVDSPSPGWAELGRRIGNAFGLRHFGVDFRAPSAHCRPSRASVLEVNPRPGLTQLYRIGHREVVLKACRRVLAALFQEEVDGKPVGGGGKK